MLVLKKGCTGVGALALTCLMLMLAACSDQETAQEPQTRFELVCDANQQACSSAISGEAVALDGEGSEAFRLTLTPSSPGLPALKPLSFELQVAAPEQRALLEEGSLVAAWFEGRDMFMGEHRLEFTFTPGNHTFLLKGMIPVCVTGTEMVWRLNLQLKINNRKVHAYADLRTLKQIEQT